MSRINHERIEQIAEPTTGSKAASPAERVLGNVGCGFFDLTDPSVTQLEGLDDEDQLPMSAVGIDGDFVECGRGPVLVVDDKIRITNVAETKLLGEFETLEAAQDYLKSDTFKTEMQIRGEEGLEYLLQYKEFNREVTGLSVDDFNTLCRLAYYTDHVAENSNELFYEDDDGNWHSLRGLVDEVEHGSKCGIEILEFWRELEEVEKNK